MDSTITAAIISGSVLLIIDIFTNIRGWRKAEKTFENRLNNIENRIGINEEKTLRKDIQDNFDGLSSSFDAQFGTHDHYNKSLSVQHDEIRELINTKSKEQSDHFANQMKIIKEINERDKFEICRNEQIENSLSKQTIEAKQIFDSFSYLTHRTEELEFELKKAYEESAAKSNEIDCLRKQIDDLNQVISNYEAEKSKPLSRHGKSGL